MGSMQDHIKENQKVQKEISKILESTHSNKRKKKELLELKQEKNDPMAISQIDYYLRRFGESKKKKILCLLCFLLVMSYGIFTGYRIYVFYQAKNGMTADGSNEKSVANDTSNMAKSKSDYIKMIDSGCCDYKIYDELANIYIDEGHGNEAANLLLQYLNDFYSYGSCTRDNLAYNKLISIPGDQLSEENQSAITMEMEDVERYSEAYDEILGFFHDGNYEKASPLCRSLEKEVSGGFFTLASVVTSYMAEEKYDEAYEYVMQQVRKPVVGIKWLSYSQRRLLAECLLEHLSDDKYDDVVHFLTDELDQMEALTSEQLADPFLPKEEAKNILDVTLKEMNYKNALDQIFLIYDDTILYRGEECYALEFCHVLNGEDVYRYFYIDMKGCIYLDQEGFCWPITNALEMMDEEIESTEILGAAGNQYAKKDGGNIILSISKNGKYFTLKDVSKDKPIIENGELILDDQGLFATYEMGDCTLHIIIDALTMRILVDEDSKGHYSRIEGSYDLVEK